MKKARKNEVLTPGIEIIVRTGDKEVAVIAFFRDGTRGYDVVCGIDDSRQRDSICAALQQAAEAMAEASFHVVDAEGTQDTGPF